MRPPVLPSGNLRVRRRYQYPLRASMRPPVLPSGNAVLGVAVPAGVRRASMRPPVLPSGNSACRCSPCACTRSCFNEAAGFTQRKPKADAIEWLESRRASMRPPVLPSGNSTMSSAADNASASGFNEAAGFTQRKHYRFHSPMERELLCFNEAAGFTQRKREPGAPTPGCR